MALNQKDIEQYLADTQKFLFASVTQDNKSDIRILGGFITDGLVTYFASAKEANKVKQIIANPNVSAYFEKPDQAFPNYINVTVYGEATVVVDAEEFDKAANGITNRLPHLQINKDTSAIIKISPKKIKVFNAASELLNEKIQIFEV